MNPNNWGRLCKIFVTRGLMDKPRAGSVGILPIMWGLAALSEADAANAEISALTAEITPDEAARVAPLSEGEEQEFWAGYRTQVAHKRRGRPYKGSEPRRKVTVYITASHLWTLRMAGEGSINDGLAAIVEEYTKIPVAPEA